MDEETYIPVEVAFSQRLSYRPGALFSVLLNHPHRSVRSGCGRHPVAWNWIGDKHARLEASLSLSPAPALDHILLHQPRSPEGLVAVADEEGVVEELLELVT